jgi:hypothetical protein
MTGKPEVVLGPKCGCGKLTNNTIPWLHNQKMTHHWLPHLTPVSSLCSVETDIGPFRLVLLQSCSKPWTKEEREPAKFSKPQSARLNQDL